MIIALSCIYSFLLLLFTIAFLVDWIRSRKKIRKYLKYGVWVGLTIVGLDIILFTVFLIMGNYTLLLGLIAEPIVFIRLTGFTMLGMYYAAEMGHPSLPLVLKKFKPATVHEPAESLSEIETIEVEVENYEVDPQSDQEEHEPVLPIVDDVFLPIGLKAYLFKALGAGAVCVIYSVLLFLLVKPQQSELLQQLFGLPATNTETEITFHVILAVIEVAIAEEIVFRLGIQNFLAKYLKLKNNRYWIAIIITSALWTMGHAGALDPQWVKFAQIFPIGLLLGWMNKKLGVESAIIAHLMMNLILTPLARVLIG